MESTLAYGPIDLTPIAEGLFISDWPETGDAPRLEAEGVRLLLSMHWRRPPAVYHRPPFETVWLPTIDLPFTPMPLRSLRRGVLAALPVLERREGVLAHCVFGRHRGVAMGCCVLIGLGQTAEEAMALVAAKRAVADPYVGYIRRRIEAFEREWRGRRS
jgi:hypothetical protein